MNYTLIILGILLVVVIYILYKVISEKGKSVVNKLTSTESNGSMGLNNLSKPNSSRYYLSWWLYIDQLSASGTNIFTIQHTTNAATPVTNVRVTVDVDANSKMTYKLKESTGTAATDLTMMENFPLQKWVYCVLSVDNDLVDIYIDGKMVRSQKMGFKVKHPSGDDGDEIKFARHQANSGNKFYLAKMDRIPQPMDPSNAWSKYMEGNGGNYFSRLFSNYGASFTITKDDLDVRKFDLM
jgi:hypothetical protein